MKRREANLIKYQSAEECPSFFDHTPHPSGYIEDHAWMKKMGRTHNQVRCTKCGYWAIWEPKASAVPSNEENSGAAE